LPCGTCAASVTGRVAAPAVPAAACADPRALLSPPTRRSSDLEPRRWHILRTLQRAFDALDLADVPGSAARVRALLAPALPGTSRSEEHTSELQSRENLVCRLLLEKKKQTRGAAPGAVERVGVG